MDGEDHRPGWGRACSPLCCLPVRVAVCILVFVGMLCAFTNRVSLSLAMTVMVVRHKHNTTSSAVQYCPPSADAANETVTNSGEFNWSEKMQGIILGSFYFGYCVSHLPGGILADKYGSKIILGPSIFVSGLTCAISPFVVRLGGPWCLVACRVFMGFSQGTLFPALTTLMSAWVPAKERATLGSFVYSGSTMGTILTNLFSGYLLQMLAWPNTFYLFGCISMLWALLFMISYTSYPGIHYCIKPKELKYLSESINIKKQEKPPTPWKKMLFRKSMFGFIIGHLGHDWGYFVMITNLPKYMADVVNVRVSRNGVFSALPFLAMWITTVLSGMCADWLIRTDRVSLIVERKATTIFAAVGPGVFMVIASYAGCDKTAVVCLFTMAMLCMGPYYAGQRLTAMDMAPSYAGTLMAFGNGIGAMMGLISPMAIGLITPNASLGEWRIVFWLSLIILSISALFFGLWGVADVQDYDPLYEDYMKKKAEKENALKAAKEAKANS